MIYYTILINYISLFHKRLPLIRTNKYICKKTKQKKISLLSFSKWEISFSEAKLKLELKFYSFIDIKQ